MRRFFLTARVQGPTHSPISNWMFKGATVSRGHRLPIEQLNSLRIQAVKLRLAGNTLKTISAATGLSPPTIIAAHKAWQNGGWNAVPIRERGRKTGEGRMLSAEQELEVYQTLVTSTPQAHQLPYLLWQLDAMRALIHQQYQITLPDRTAAHYLQRWRLNAERPAQRIANAPVSVKRWHQSTYHQIACQARAEGGDIFWVDDVGAPEPGQKRRHGVLRAMSNRGKVLWLPYDGSLRAPHLESFFDRLQRSTGRKLFALLSGMQWQRAATFSAWASRRTEQLQLFHLPEASDMLIGAHALAEDMRQPPRA